MLGGLEEPLGQRGDDPVELGVHGLGVGLVEDGAYLGATCGCAERSTLVSKLRR